MYRTVVVALLVSVLACGDDGGTPAGPDPTPSPPTPAGILISPGAAALASAGDTITLSAAVVAANGDTLGTAVRWATDDSTVLTVSSAGLLSAVRPGSATVTAESDGLEASSSIEVYEYFVHVALQGREEFTLIDSRTNAPIDQVAVGDNARGLALTADGAWAVVANTLDNTVSIADVSLRQTVATLPVGDAPGEVAISPDGAWAYVVNINSGDVSVVDMDARVIAETIPIGGVSWDVAFATDGARAYVANNRNSVAVIDVPTHSVVDSIRAGIAQDIAVAPSGDVAYVARSATDNVAVVDLGTGAVTQVIPVRDRPHDVAFTPDGAFVYVANAGSDTVSVIETSSMTVVQDVPTGTEPVWLDVTPDGSRVYVVTGLANGLSVIETATNAVIDTIDLGGGALPRAVAIGPPVLPPR